MWYVQRTGSSRGKLHGGCFAKPLEAVVGAARGCGSLEGELQDWCGPGMH